jgi:hypothetical protein
MHEITFQPIANPDTEMISEWAWICRQWPICLQKGMEVGAVLQSGDQFCSGCDKSPLWCLWFHIAQYLFQGLHV